MFPTGEFGWHGDIPRIGCLTKRQKRDQGYTPDRISFLNETAAANTGTSLEMCDDEIGGQSNAITRARARKRSNVSFREYYVYKFQHRYSDRSYIVRFGRLFQQYIIDSYIKLESMRLAYLEENQKKLRCEYYQGVIDSVVSGIQIGSKVGKRIYLSPTFIGGPRDMRQRYLDSMALVQQFGRPDIFLTMTCNPNWPEIKELLQPGEESQNRPDLVARVFKAKLSILNDIIMSGIIFGDIAAVVHVIEFQKRGLPHAHFLIILKPSSKCFNPEAYNRIVCAELPNKELDPYLYNLVVKHMMHGPCGELNPTNVCMRDEMCKNHYPKEFADFTSHGKGNYPIYRRRNDARTAKVRGHILDNRWVIPYNAELLVQFNCHMNVEVCCDIRAVKYLYKYIHKGHDKVMFRIASNSFSSESCINEIADYQNARWVSPVEAAWRIFGFPLSGMYPAVLQLQIHLPNFQCVQFEDNADLEELLQNERSKRSMLTEFFTMNATDIEAQNLNLLYREFPQFYVWDRQSRFWTRRKRGVVVGRVCTVNPVENERYYLRILLGNVRCPLSFNDLLMVNGLLCESFQSAAKHRGLLHNDNDMDKTMQEASLYQMPFELRRLFATLLHYCKPSDCKRLYDAFYENMAEDFKNTQDSLLLSDNDIRKKVIQGISDTLESLGRDVNEFHLVDFKHVVTYSQCITREINAEMSIPIPDEDLHAINQLNKQQRSAFDIIYNASMSGTGGAYFLDGPGGTGKSFVYKVLLAHIRPKGYIAVIVASSGIASSVFLGGRTAHSRFKIPIDGGDGVKCQISVQSGEAELLRTSKIIIWDEAPMANKSVIHAVDKLLQDICENELLFGGKLVVFGGNFRQVLPVVRRGTKANQIEASIVTSDLWKLFIKLRLTENMRAKTDPIFTDFPMRIGNGEEPTNERNEVQIPQPVLIPYTTFEESLENLISYIYSDLSLFQSQPLEMMSRIILCPKNDFVDDINSRLINRFPGNEVTYISDDQAKNSGDQGDYIDYLNSLEPRGLPQHKLILKTNCPVILLRNINPVEGLCNGTRLICKYLSPNVLEQLLLQVSLRENLFGSQKFLYSRTCQITSTSYRLLDDKYQSGFVLQ